MFMSSFRHIFFGHSYTQQTRLSVLAVSSFRCQRSQPILSRLLSPNRPTHTHLHHTLHTNPRLKMAIPNIKLNSGDDMPQVGFGLWKVDGPAAADTVYNAIKAGYRLFDGACGKYPALPLSFCPWFSPLWNRPEAPLETGQDTPVLVGVAPLSPLKRGVGQGVRTSAGQGVYSGTQKPTPLRFTRLRKVLSRLLGGKFALLRLSSQSSPRGQERDRDYEGAQYRLKGQKPGPAFLEYPSIYPAMPHAQISLRQ